MNKEHANAQCYQCQPKGFANTMKSDRDSRRDQSIIDYYKRGYSIDKLVDVLLLVPPSKEEMESREWVTRGYDGSLSQCEEYEKQRQFWVEYVAALVGPVKKTKATKTKKRGAA